MRSVMSVLCLALFASGCSDLGPTALNGKWAQDLSQVESSWEIDLTVSGAAVTGTGTWYGEACCSGTLSASGTVSGTAVHLDIVSTPTGSQLTSTSTFDGKLVSSTLLKGTITYHQDPPGPGPISFVLHRQ